MNFTGSLLFGMILLCSKFVDPKPSSFRNLLSRTDSLPEAKLSGGAKRGGLAPGAGRVASARSTALPSSGAWKASRRKLVADKLGANPPPFRSRTKFRSRLDVPERTITGELAHRRQRKSGERV